LHVACPVNPWNGKDKKSFGGIHPSISHQDLNEGSGRSFCSPLALIPVYNGRNSASESVIAADKGGVRRIDRPAVPEIGRGVR
jgi:hypothetical protein